MSVETNSNFNSEQFDHWIALNNFDGHSPEKLRAACAWVVEYVRNFKSELEKRNAEVEQLRYMIRRAQIEAAQARRDIKGLSVEDALKLLGWTAPGDLPDGAEWSGE